MKKVNESKKLKVKVGSVSINTDDFMKLVYAMYISHLSLQNSKDKYDIEAYNIFYDFLTKYQKLGIIKLNKKGGK